MKQLFISVLIVFLACQAFAQFGGVGFSASGSVDSANFAKLSGGNRFSGAQNATDFRASDSVTTAKLYVVDAGVVTPTIESTNSVVQIQLSPADAGAVSWLIQAGDVGQPGSLNVRQSGVLNALTILKTSGNVGINNTSPSAKLQVNGLAWYTDKAAARAAGLTTGAFYMSGVDSSVVSVVP